MPVTELARLSLQSGTEASSPDLLANLARAKEVMEEASGFRFQYYHCVEETDVIYILGAWPSVDFHMQEFIPGKPNQEMLALLKDQVTVDWMFHLAIDQAMSPLPLGREYVAIGRHFIKAGDNGGFTTAFEASKHNLQSFIGGTKHVVGGYRIDKGFDPSLEGGKPEEFVLFTGWNSVDQHLDFAKSEEFEKYSQIRNHLGGAEIKHAKALEVGETAQK